jgi:DUF917 family protein
MAITDEKGNIGISETISNKWTERLARVQTVGLLPRFSLKESQCRECHDLLIDDR